MPTIHDTPPAPVQTDLNSLVQSLNAVIPAKNDTNLLIATWNLRRFGSLTREWTAVDNITLEPATEDCRTAKERKSR